MAKKRRKIANPVANANGYYPYRYRKLLISSRKIPVDYLLTDSKKKERRKRS